jgi:hypothetical protein
MSNFVSAPPPEDMRRFLVGFFVSDLAILLHHLTPDELKAYLLFRVEYLFAGATGLVDDDCDLARRLKCKAWPAVKAKLHTLGCIYTDAGVLRDPQFDISIERQRKTKERQRANANRRWSVAKIGGVA